MSTHLRTTDQQLMYQRRTVEVVIDDPMQPQNHTDTEARRHRGSASGQAQLQSGNRRS